MTNHIKDKKTASHEANSNSVTVTASGFYISLAFSSQHNDIPEIILEFMVFGFVQ